MFHRTHKSWRRTKAIKEVSGTNPIFFKTAAGRYMMVFKDQDDSNSWHFRVQGELSGRAPSVSSAMLHLDEWAHRREQQMTIASVKKSILSLLIGIVSAPVLF